jgi:biofilm PGA synthesis N-glycosyltransferase PgaC
MNPEQTIGPYVIVTPAHNEEAFIEETAKSIVSQTILPLKWVVVNDGSVDRTQQIIEQYARRFDFIQLVNQPRDPERNFARKVFAFNRGLAEVQGLPFEFIGNVDADISFETNYFRNILQELAADPALGISGGIVYTKFTDRFLTYDTTLDSVGGKVQLFRRRCFEDIGGYRPLKYGGIDATAETMARMKGWKVRKSLENRAYEHRPTGFAYGKPLIGKMCEGRRFYSLGYDPIFYSLRCLYRFNEHPFILGSAAALLRFLYGMIRREPIVLPPEVTSYLRAEQRTKIKQVLRFWSHNS